MEILPLDQLIRIFNDALDGTAKLRKSFKTFFVITSILFLSMTKRKIFTRLALSCDCCESRFRQNFRKNDEVKDGFLLCLLGSDKPIIESLQPNAVDQTEAQVN